MTYSFRKPYHSLKLSATEFFTQTVRPSWATDGPESEFEKPYLDLSYPEMQLQIPVPDWPPGGGGRPNPEWPSWDWPEYPPIEWPGWPDVPGIDWPSDGIPVGPGYDPDWPDGGWPPWAPLPSNGEGVGERCKACAIGCVGALGCGDVIECRVLAECVYDPGHGASCSVYKWGGSQGAPRGGSIEVPGDYYTAGMARIEAQVAMAFSTCPEGDPGWHVSGDYIEAWLENIGGNTCHLMIRPNCNKSSADIQVKYVTKLCEDCYERETHECGSCTQDYTMQYETLEPEPGQVQELSITKLLDSLENCKQRFSWGIESGGGTLSEPSGLKTKFTAPSSDCTTVVVVTCTDSDCPAGCEVASTEFTANCGPTCEEAEAIVFTAPTSANAVVAPGGALTLTITGGVGPYTWSHDGIGGKWSLDYSETETGSNVLRFASNSQSCATNGATVTVTVTDDCGVLVHTGAVVIRNSQGAWSNVHSNGSSATPSGKTCGSTAVDIVLEWLSSTLRQLAVLRVCYFNAGAGCAAYSGTLAYTGDAPQPTVGPDVGSCTADSLCSDGSNCNGSTGLLRVSSSRYQQWIC